MHATPTDRSTMHDQLRTPHVAEVLDLVRRDGVSAASTRQPFAGDTGATGVTVSSPVLAVALRHNLNPVALQHNVDRYVEAQRHATARAADAVRAIPTDTGVVHGPARPVVTVDGLRALYAARRRDPWANDPDRTTRRESVTNGDDWPISFNG